MSGASDHSKDLDLFLEQALESLDDGVSAGVDDEELAVLASGNLDQLPEADRKRILEQVATDPVARKVVADLQKSGLAGMEGYRHDRPRKIRGRRLIAAVLAAAACVVIVVLIRGLAGPSTSLMNEVAKARDWLSRPSALSSVSPTGPLPFHLATALPSLKPAAARTMGAGQNRFMNEMLATVSITLDDPAGGRKTPGLGSGVLISPEGWIITVYQVVAPSVQTAALQGGIARVGIVTGVEVEDRIQARDGKLSARVYLADPATNLALLKLDSLPPGVKQMPYVRLAERATLEEDCNAFLIGTWQGRTAWTVSAGVVTGIRSLEQIRRSLVLTDCSFSPSDAGGLLTNAAGELIGLNWRMRGECGGHVPVEWVRAVYREISTLDRTGPKGAPFDIWTAGLPSSAQLEPYIRQGDRSDPVSILVHRHVKKTAEGIRPEAVALFIDFDGRREAEVPRGLWGMECKGRFSFDVCVVIRADGILAVGFMGDDGAVDRIRIDHDRDGTADVLWQRTVSGEWTAAIRPDSPSLVDGSGLSPENAGMLRDVLGH